MSGYYAEADPSLIEREYPLGEAFLSGVARIGSDELHALQERRFLAVVARAWQVPFYRRRWGEAGIDPGDIRGLEDLRHLPVFSKEDLMASVAAYPPFGDYHGMRKGGEGSDLRHVVFHTTSGTTGTPQPLFFGARDREIQNALLARAYLLHGLRSDDMVQSVYGFGPVNGGHYIRETILHYTEAMLLPAGTGRDTPSKQQVALMHHFGVTVLLGFADYMLRLAEAARAAGLHPGEDLALRLISGHVPHDMRYALSQAWGGAAVRDWYGVGDTGTIASQGPDGSGLHVWEDAHVVELLDPQSHAPVGPGEAGNVCVTVLFKDGIYPIIRFDTNDLSRFLPGSTEPVPAFRRLAGFLGRSDNMVKLRGINVYPTSIGGMLSGFEEANGEYVCLVRRSQGRDEMTLRVEWQAECTPAATARVATHLRSELGVGVDVVLASPGETAALTGIDSRQKPRRLIDER